MTEEDIMKFMSACATRINDLNDRVMFLEDQLTKIVNILGGTNNKPLCERAGDE
jgi:hypothetical protein